MKTTIYGKAIIVFAVIFSIAIVSCKKNATTYPPPSTSKTPAANEVVIQSMAFSPSTLTVTAGTTVKFTNNDGVTHTVTSNTNAFDSGSLIAGNSFTNTFSTPGTYAYHCKIHTSMTGTIVVQ